LALKNDTYKDHEKKAMLTTDDIIYEIYNTSKISSKISIEEIQNDANRTN
jgi:hypothetical protein